MPCTVLDFSAVVCVFVKVLSQVQDSPFIFSSFLAHDIWFMHINGLLDFKVFPSS